MEPVRDEAITISLMIYDVPFKISSRIPYNFVLIWTVLYLTILSLIY